MSNVCFGRLLWLAASPTLPCLQKGARTRAVDRFGLSTSRWVLLGAFGGLLALMAFDGFDAISALDKIRTSGDTIREEFLRRDRAREREAPTVRCPSEPDVAGSNNRVLHARQRTCSR